MNKRTRLEEVRRRVKPKGEIVVFWNDIDNEFTYDAPPEEPGACRVSEEEIAQALKTKTVIRVQYKEKGIV